MITLRKKESTSIHIVTLQHWISVLELVGRAQIVELVESVCKFAVKVTLVTRTLSMMIHNVSGRALTCKP